MKYIDNELLEDAKTTLDKTKEGLITVTASESNEKNGKVDVVVTFDNGNSLITTINTDLEGAKKYYIGRSFNLGNGEKDTMAKAVKVEILK
jgi:hypothetical protein